MKRTIKDVTFSEVGKYGEQIYTFSPTPSWTTGAMILGGSEITPNIEVGDKGCLEYRNIPPWGMWFFRPEKKA